MFNALQKRLDRLIAKRFHRLKRVTRVQRSPILAFAVACVLMVVGLLTTAYPITGQSLNGSPADPRFKFSTPLPSGIASPAKVETRLGTLNFFDGFPDKPTAEKLYDNLDFQRAVQAYLLAIPAVSQATNRNAIRTLGPVNTVVPIFEQLLDSRSIFLTANDNTVYSWTWLDLTQGPLVLEVPPKVLGTVNDIWFRWVIDVGITGPDKGEGGKYLFLPFLGEQLAFVYQIIISMTKLPQFVLRHRMF